VTVEKSTCVASKFIEPNTATGTTPLLLGLTALGSLPGLMSIVTGVGTGGRGFLLKNMPLVYKGGVRSSKSETKPVEISSSYSPPKKSVTKKTPPTNAKSSGFLIKLLLPMTVPLASTRSIA